MKIVHTADWHLGKKLQNVDLLNDQKIVLQSFIQDLKIEKPDVVIIAGDLYDRAIPSKEAVELLNDTFHTIVLEMGIPTFAIAGNHDSASRLHFGSSFMEKHGLHLIGKYTLEYEPIILTDAFGEVHFHLVPFFDPSGLKNHVKDVKIESFDDAIKYVTEFQKAHFDKNVRHVFIGHLFVTPQGEVEENTSDSERILSVGGAEYVNAHYFMDYDYTALGHLHQPHFVGAEHIRYAGSLMKYSQSEENHNKGYYLVELNEKGTQPIIEHRPLTMPHDIRTIKANLSDILNMDKSDDYVFIELTDITPILSPMAKVRAVFPNCMRVTRQLQAERIKTEKLSFADREKLDEKELFKAFYEEATGQKASETVERIFNDAFQELAKRD